MSLSGYEPCACGGQKRRGSRSCRICFVNATTAQSVKWCNGCRRDRQLSAFRTRPGGIISRRPRSRCMECEARDTSAYRAANPEKHVAAKRAWEANNPDKHRRGILRRNCLKLGVPFYRIDEIVDRLLAPGDCEACGANVQRLRVDHDHDSGDFRGLICETCNLGIGLFGDDPARLRGAAEYLERHAR